MRALPEGLCAEVGRFQIRNTITVAVPFATSLSSITLVYIIVNAEADESLPCCKGATGPDFLLALSHAGRRLK